MHAVNVRLNNAGKIGDHTRDFRRRYVFTLPTKCIADSIDEIKESLFVSTHEIASVIPGITALEYVTKNLLLRISNVSVTFEFRSLINRVIAYPADRFANLVRYTSNAEALLVAHRRSGYGVRLDQC